MHCSGLYYFDAFSLKNDINFQIKGCYDIIMTSYLRRPYNFGIFQRRRPKFANMIYFDVLSLKMSLVFKFKASMMSSICSLQRPCNIVTLMFLNV